MDSILFNTKKWFDDRDLRMHMCIWLAYVHLLAFIGFLWFTVQPSNVWNQYFILLVTLHFFAGLGITGGAHRLWSHKAYQANFALRVFYMLINCLAFQGSIYHWSRDHRLHHKFSDTPLDPHDVTKGFFFSHCGWLLKKKTKELIQEGQKLDLSDLNGDSVVMFQKKHYLKLVLLIAFIIPTILGYTLIGGSIIFNFLFFGFFRYALILNATWCVNSVCHTFGSRPYNNKILPRENLFVSIIAIGEGWHNWHHEYPKDWKASKDEWWMFNPTTTFIRICSQLGLCNTNRVKNLKD